MDGDALGPAGPAAFEQVWAGGRRAKRTGYGTSAGEDVTPNRKPLMFTREQSRRR